MNNNLINVLQGFLIITVGVFVGLGLIYLFGGFK
jgi:hypothetical protein